MPDYDPDSIPILDDIIKSDSQAEASSEVVELESSDTSSIALADESLQDDFADSDDNLDLFTAEPVVDFTDNDTVDGIEPEQPAEQLDGETLADDIDQPDEALLDEQQSDSLDSLENYRDDELNDRLQDDALSQFSALDDDDNDSVIIDVSDSEAVASEYKAAESTIDTADIHAAADESNNFAEVLIEEPTDETVFQEENEVIESALIDYQQADAVIIDTSEDIIDVSSTATTAATIAPTTVDNDNNPPELIENIDDASDSDTFIEEQTSVLSQTEPQVEPIALQPLVNDIVKQLMPDLEQQLRFLVQQALEDRLPQELIKEDDE